MFHTSAYYGITGLQAPEWNVNKWVNLPAGQDAFKLADLEGQIVYLFNFQAWCTGCHDYGFPTLLRVQDEFGSNPHVSFAAIQTAFEGAETNTAQQAAAIAHDYQLNFPVGHDPAMEGGRPQIMRDYRAGGTPWTVIIDSAGVVRFNDFYIDVPHASRLIHYLISRK